MFDWIMGLGFAWITVIVFGLAILGGVVWYVLPILMVRRHGLEDALDKSHHEDSARKTVGYAITGLGVVVPWIFAAGQFIITRQAEQKENERKYTHDIGVQFLASMQQYVDMKNKADKFEVRIQLIYDLERMALSVNGPPEHFIVPIADSLKRLVGDYAKLKPGDGVPPIFVRYGCGEVPKEKVIRERNENDDLVRAAFGSLGRLRAKAEFPMRLEVLQFDNIDVSKKREKPTDTIGIAQSYTGAHFAGSYFRRSDLTGASFAKADFRGAHFGDEEVPGFSPEIAARLYKDDEYDEVQRYRCWIADFRGANLVDGNFSGANLAGADFSGAKLSDARFDGAEISRADFRKSDVTAKQLCAAKWDVRYMPKTGFGAIDKAKCAREAK